MTAFNYDRQRWLDGVDGARKRREQVEEQLVILQGQRGEEYAKFIGAGSLEGALAVAREELALSVAGGGRPSVR